jgi:hypothetical protein
MAGMILCRLVKGRAHSRDPMGSKKEKEKRKFRSMRVSYKKITLEKGAYLKPPISEMLHSS